MYHYCSLRWASITFQAFRHAFRAVSTSSSLVARAEIRKAHKNNPQPQSRDQQYFSLRTLMNSKFFNVLARSVFEYLSLDMMIANASSLPAFLYAITIIRQHIVNKHSSFKHFSAFRHESKHPSMRTPPDPSLSVLETSGWSEGNAPNMAKLWLI